MIINDELNPDASRATRLRKIMQSDGPDDKIVR